VSSLVIEAAERHRELVELERTLMRELHSTVFGYAYKMAVLLSALINALAPLLGSLAVVAPVLLADKIGMELAVTLSALAGFAELAALGAYLGSLSQGSVLKYAAALLCAGLAVMAATMLLGSTGG